MAAPVYQLSETNGSAGTVTDNVPEIAYASVDAASTTSLSVSNPVPAGNYSFEKWDRWKLVSGAPNAIVSPGVYFAATPPEDSSGASTITIRYGVNAPYATPTASASSVATGSIAGDVTAPGTALTGTGNVVGAYTGYLTTQAQVGNSANGGVCQIPNPFVYFGYTWS